MLSFTNAFGCFALNNSSSQAVSFISLILSSVRFPSQCFGRLYIPNPCWSVDRSQLKLFFKLPVRHHRVLQLQHTC
ncbi:hypothetical protein Pdw03_3503 [Penicillium digitatum]|uniref:Uncharacterized protein n=1 Tax=Penicillium digitatum TaxID=36651 RepID=A0A7T6XGE0_PENDI|nr:hypothetical protein Pdw03_3503 [Penicillium digitatum]